MTWPIPPLFTGFANDTPQLDQHPNHHNALADAINELVARGGVPEQGTYTPPWTGITLGSGAVNTGFYTFVGAQGVGGKGLIFINGEVTFGTGLAVSSSPQVSTPPGFKLSGFVSGSNYVGMATILDADAGDYTGIVRQWGSTTMLISILNTAGTYLSAAVAISATAPMTWAVGDGWQWNAVSPAERT